MTEKRRTRSPNFPAIPLEKSLDFVRKLLNKYQRHEVPAGIAIETLGYTATSSVAAQVIATLSYYGLISSKGLKEQRKLKVTDRAFTILMDQREESPEREIALKEAALSPVMFKKVLNKFPHSIPADDILKHELIFSYNFNTSSVDDFIRVFKRTISFAKVYELGIIGEESADIEEQETINNEGNTMITPPIQQQNTDNGQTLDEITSKGVQSFTIPLSKSRKAALVFESLPVEKGDINKIKKWFDFFLENFADELTGTENE